MRHSSPLVQEFPVVVNLWLYCQVSHSPDAQFPGIGAVDVGRGIVC